VTSKVICIVGMIVQKLVNICILKYEGHCEQFLVSEKQPILWSKNMYSCSYECSTRFVCENDF